MTLSELQDNYPILVGSLPAMPHREQAWGMHLCMSGTWKGEIMPSLGKEVIYPEGTHVWDGLASAVLRNKCVLFMSSLVSGVLLFWHNAEKPAQSTVCEAKSAFCWLLFLRTRNFGNRMCSECVTDMNE